MRELAVLAFDTGCRGLELRRVGDNFGGSGVIDALRRVLPVVVICVGGCFRVEGVAWVGVLARDVGVVDRLVGVFALEIGWGGCCCFEIFPLVGGRFAGAGELDRVEETGLPGVEELVNFLTDTGRREDRDSGCCNSCKGGSEFCLVFVPARSLWVR